MALGKRIRILVYAGPTDWIDNTLHGGGVPADGFYTVGDSRSIVSKTVGATEFSFTAQELADILELAIQAQADAIEREKQFDADAAREAQWEELDDDDAEDN